MWRELYQRRVDGVESTGAHKRGDGKAYAASIALSFVEEPFSRILAVLAADQLREAVPEAHLSHRDDELWSSPEKQGENEEHNDVD